MSFVPGFRTLGLQLFGSVLVGGVLAFVILYRTFRLGRAPDQAS
jgi:hypothetical protein